MRILNAIDAISPAIARTRLVLFTPFRKGRTWKFCATAYLATAGSMFLPFPLIFLVLIPLADEKAGHGFATFIIVLVIACTALYLLIFYLCSRIRFAFFDVVLNRDQLIAPAWRKYGPQSLRWTLFKVVLGTLFGALLAAPMAAYIRSIVSAFLSLHLEPGQQPPPEFFTRILATYAVVFVVYFVIGLFFFVSSLLNDFIVPSLALEDTTLGEAFRRLGQLIRREPGQFTFYALLKLGMGFAGYFAAGFVFEIVILLALLIVGCIAGGIGFLLYLAHVPIGVLIVLGVILGIAFYIFMVFYCFQFVIGTLITFLEAYKLYFLGGRYPMLGDLLDRSTPLPASLPPPPPGYAYAAPSVYAPAAYVTAEPVAPPPAPPSEPESHS
jgi:hypothetical protein